MLGVAVQALDDGHRVAVRELARALLDRLAAKSAGALGFALRTLDALVAVLALAVRTVPGHW